MGRSGSAKNGMGGWSWLRRSISWRNGKSSGFTSKSAAIEEPWWQVAQSGWEADFLLPVLFFWSSWSDVWCWCGWCPKCCLDWSVSCWQNALAAVQLSWKVKAMTNRMIHFLHMVRIIYPIGFSTGLQICYLDFSVFINVSCYLIVIEFSRIWNSAAGSRKNHHWPLLIRDTFVFIQWRTTFVNKKRLMPLKLPPYFS